MAINLFLVSNILNRKHITWIILHKNPSNMHLYTGCPRRNVPDFGRMFLMLKYNYITQNTYIQSWTVKEIMAREKCGFLAVPRTVPVQLTRYLYTAHVRPRGWNAANMATALRTVVPSCKNAFCVFPRGILWHAFCVWILWWQCTCCCWRIPKAFSRSKDSV